MVLEITPKMNQCAHITIKQHLNPPTKEKYECISAEES